MIIVSQLPTIACMYIINWLVNGSRKKIKNILKQVYALTIVNWQLSLIYIIYYSLSGFV